MAGILGEYAACAALGGAARQDNTYDWDVSFYGATFDVKTKVRTVPPKLDYVGSVNTLNGKQKCNYYIFVSINKDLTKAHVMGYIPSDLFFNTATPLKKGDGDGNNNFKAKCDVFNIEYNKLYSICELGRS